MTFPSHPTRSADPAALIWPLAAGESAHLGTYPFTATASMITSGAVVYNNVANQPIGGNGNRAVNITERASWPHHSPALDLRHRLSDACHSGFLGHHACCGLPKRVEHW
ncbi:MAG: hypothetical protein R2911_45890 [Caldilineaceae bacterium]